MWSLYRCLRFAIMMKIEWEVLAVRTFYKMMQSKKNGIPPEKLQIFENILETYFVPGRGSNEGDNKFWQALGDQFTLEERFRLWEQSGGCRGTGREKARKAFAVNHADKPLALRLKLYIAEFASNLHGKTRSITLDEENQTLTVRFACDECYKHFLGGKITAPYTLHYESCAGGRMQNLQSALGIKLRIQSVDIPAVVSMETPCTYTYTIVQ